MKKIYRKNLIFSIIITIIFFGLGEFYFFYFHNLLISHHLYFLATLSLIVFTFSLYFMNYRIKKKEEIFEILESVNSPILILNKNLRIIKYNKKAAEELDLAGYFKKKKEIYFSPVSFKMFDEKGNEFEKFTLTDGIIMLQIKNENKYFEIKYKEMRDERGEIKNYVVTLSNITQLIESSKKIENSYKILELIHYITKNIYFMDSLKKIIHIILQKSREIKELGKVKIYLKKGQVFYESESGRIFEESSLNFLETLLKKETFKEENLAIKKEISEFEESLIQESIFSYFCVPFFAHDALLGFICCGLEKSGKFDEEIIKSVEEIADMLSLWSEKESLFEETREYLNNLKMLAEMTSRFSIITSLEETYKYAIQKVKEISKADWVTIFLLDKSGERLIAGPTLNVPKKIEEKYKILSLKSVTGNAIVKKEPILLEKYVEHPEAIKDKFLIKYVKSLVAIPIKDEKENIIGVVDLIYTKGKKFSEREREMYNAIGSQIGIAIQNARLHEERKKYTDHLEKLVKERTQKIEKLNKELEEYIYSISHDLRTPLMAIEGYSHLLLSKFGEKLYGEIKEYVKHINNAARRTIKLIEDLLRYSKLGKEIKVEPVNIKEVLQYVIANLKKRIEEEETKIEYPENFPMIRANFELLTQIFQNLISNSIKFRKREENPLIKIYYKIVPGKIKIYFEDNGIGIEEKNLSRIFNIFTQLDREYEGTGIGLAIVKKAMEMLNGEIEVISSPGKGTLFCLKFNYP